MHTCTNRVCPDKDELQKNLFTVRFTVRCGKMILSEEYKNDLEKKRIFVRKFSEVAKKTLTR